MPYEYSLTYQDFKDAQVLYRKHSTRAALDYYFFLWVLPALSVLGSVVSIASRISSSSSSEESFSSWPLAGILFAIFIAISRVRTLRRLWKQLVPPDLPGKAIELEIPARLEFNHEQIISTVPGRSEGRFFWTTIVDFAENDKLALLFVRKKNFLFIPKRALPESAWSELRSLALHQNEAMNVR